MGRTRNHALRTAVILLFLCLFAVVSAGVEVYPDESGSVQLEFGEAIESYVIVHNPLDEQNTITVSTSPSLNGGRLVANLVVDGQHTSEKTIHVGAEKNRTVQIQYTAVSCTQNSCDGDNMVTARSLETGSTSSISIPVTVTRRQEIYGSPGITGVEFIVLMMVGTVFFLYMRP